MLNKVNSTVRSVGDELDDVVVVLGGGHVARGLPTRGRLAASGPGDKIIS